jgi:hypothetical protein
MAMIGGVTSAALPDPRNTAATVGVASITALRYAQSDGYGVVMPVRPAQALFAAFRHIRLLPDTRLQDGVPLYKLRILDTLIDELSPGAASPARGARAASGSLGGARTVDRLIGELAGGLRAAEEGAARGVRSSAYRAGFLPLPGAFVDLVA